jgi:hypothetical protein
MLLSRPVFTTLEPSLKLSSTLPSALFVSDSCARCTLVFVLGIEPELGREFDTNAEIPGNELQVILSDRLWRTQFGADSKIIGHKVTLNAQPFTVVGAMPPGPAHPGNEYHAVSYGEDVDLWSPFAFEGNPAQRGSHYIEGIGRLNDGVTAETAQGEVMGWTRPAYTS